MMNKIVKALPLTGGYLQIRMQDGRSGEFDVNPYMNSDFFAALKDDNYFKKANIFFWCRLA